MEAFICTACGTQYPPSDAPPQHCPICEEERQYIPPRGQTWTTLGALAAGHFNSYRQHEAGVIGIGTQPAFAIGQRALLVCTPHGNVLWDYTTMVEWSLAFGAVPIHLHAADKRWIMRPGPSVRLWEGDTLDVLPDVTLIRCGGHFPGGTVLHWAKGAGGRGVVCSSDIATVTTDRKFLSFMRSYPNLIPLSARQVEGIAAALAPFAFDTIYGHYFDRVIPRDAKRILDVSVKRYVAALSGAYENE